jgi:hypothetical protein
MKKPRAIGVVPVEMVDILGMELEQNLPYWLSPIEKYNNSPQVREARRKKYKQQWAKDHPRKKTSK